MKADRRQDTLVVLQMSDGTIRTSSWNYRASDTQIAEFVQDHQRWSHTSKPIRYTIFIGVSIPLVEVVIMDPTP